MYAGIIGFPGSGDQYAFELLCAFGFSSLHGRTSWRALLPEHRPQELVSREPSKEGRNRRVSGNPIPFNPVVHLMRYPWHAITAATELPLDDLVLIRTAVGINPKAPACHLNTRESVVKVLTLAFPKWYDMIRGLNPDIMLKVESPDAVTAFKKLLDVKPFFLKESELPVFKLPLPEKTVTYEVAVAIAGQLAASQVEVIAKNLYKQVPKLL